ncbi:hypothetical protein A8950_1269 [Dongia mobilis]|uniref:Uncharacterized protein n=2 Tax=Dongia mobilis TaxID=578943 RepID=A0A4R6WYW1_9PROT|nr:hypothetical protein A8950_1269 [Dongia mobilis]
MRFSTRFVIALSLMAPICAAFPVLAEDVTEQTIKAFSAWQGRGQVFETAENRATFVGSFSGVVYVESEKGPLDAGFMICPAIVDIDLRDGTQQAKGRCTIVAKDASRAYADINCTGVHLVGCDGEFTFTGGTERFAGITGGGPVTIRSSLHEIPAGAGNVVQESAGGIIVWPALTYRLAESAQQ